MRRIGAAMHARMTAASLPPLNTDSIFDCSEIVDDVGGIRSDVNEGGTKGSGCTVDWMVLLGTSKPSESVPALVPPEVSLVSILKEKISVWYLQTTSVVGYSGLESDRKRSEERAPTMLVVWVSGGAAIAADDIN